MTCGDPVVNRGDKVGGDIGKRADVAVVGGGGDVAGDTIGLGLSEATDAGSMRLVGGVVDRRFETPCCQAKGIEVALLRLWHRKPPAC
jgi:sugar (pentulose or hexulose) kinase